MVAGDVLDLLAREEALLEELAYRLRVQALLADAGDVLWLERASEEVAECAELLHLTSLLRATRVVDLGQELGCGSTPTLGELAEAAGGDLGPALAASRERLLAALGRVRQLAEAVSERCGARARLAGEALASLAGPAVGTYQPATGDRRLGHSSERTSQILKGVL
jgi:hypothetical protein